jgi:hypothetical protein
MVALRVARGANEQEDEYRTTKNHFDAPVNHTTQVPINAEIGKVGTKYPTYTNGIRGGGGGGELLTSRLYIHHWNPV